MDADKRPEPKPGDKYKHFKNKLYQIVAVATHSETKEKLVIYQALYGDFGVYARPYDMFMSEVDHVKYPEVTQRYRFEHVNLVNTKDKTLITEAPVWAGNQSSESILTQQIKPQNEENGSFEGETSDEINPVLLQFLEAETFKEKYEILKLHANAMEDSLIDSLAASLDIVIEDGPVSKRFDELKACVRTRERFETDRFR